MKRTILLFTVLLAATALAGDSMRVVNPTTLPVPAKPAVAGQLVQYAGHITTSTTTNVTASTASISSIHIACSNAGTSWTFKIQDKSGTPLIIVPSYTMAVATDGKVPSYNYADGPIKATSGIDIVTTGATPGTVDVFIDYYQ